MSCEALGRGVHLGRRSGHAPPACASIAAGGTAWERWRSESATCAHRCPPCRGDRPPELLGARQCDGRGVCQRGRPAAGRRAAGLRAARARHAARLGQAGRQGPCARGRRPAARLRPAAGRPARAARVRALAAGAAPLGACALAALLGGACIGAHARPSRADIRGRDSAPRNAALFAADADPYIVEGNCIGGRGPATSLRQPWPLRQLEGSDIGGAELLSCASTTVAGTPRFLALHPMRARAGGARGAGGADDACAGGLGRARGRSSAARV